MQQRLPFADGDALPQRREGQQVVKSPHAAETVRIVAAGPFLLERGQRRRARAAGPNRTPRPTGCRNAGRQPESRRRRTSRGRRAKYTAGRRGRGGNRSCSCNHSEAWCRKRIAVQQHVTNLGKLSGSHQGPAVRPLRGRLLAVAGRRRRLTTACRRVYNQKFMGIENCLR